MPLHDALQWAGLLLLVVGGFVLGGVGIGVVVAGILAVVAGAVLERDQRTDSS